MTVVMFALSGLFLLTAIHPFVTYPLSLYCARPWLRRPVLASKIAPEKLSFAICLCAYNEEAVIAQKAENLIALKEALPGLDILVYVDAATDRTAEILSQYADQIRVYVSPYRHGKTYGMNLLVSKTTASVVLFTDANVMIDVASLRNLPGYFADPQIGCVCGHLKYMNGDETATAKTGSLYWRLEEYIKRLESDTGSAMGADGAIFAIRRELHHPAPDDIIDDMFVSFNILCDGYRVVRAPDIIAYEKSATSPREEQQRKIRIACQAFNAHRLLWPRLRNLAPLDLYKYVSHKLMRWFVIYWLALTALFFEAGMVMAGAGLIGLAVMAFGAALLYVGMLRPLSVLSQLADILGAFAATGFGVWRSVLGEHFQTWAPASSTRSA